MHTGHLVQNGFFHTHMHPVIIYKLMAQAAEQGGAAQQILCWWVIFSELGASACPKPNPNSPSAANSAIFEDFIYIVESPTENLYSGFDECLLQNLCINRIDCIVQHSLFYILHFTFYIYKQQETNAAGRSIIDSHRSMQGKGEKRGEKNPQNVLIYMFSHNINIITLILDWVING